MGDIQRSEKDTGSVRPISRRKLWGWAAKSGAGPKNARMWWKRRRRRPSN